ncbi:MAG TPA: tRNA (adenosine(37)-N6)-threonylcarbamoyltransferase complex transferase subunit TsaD [Candidatus Paceibacterota bacterium]|nr:tRNA (adenosine(37)-N6)-threonylcarbamoyltransferase complex transferase subunit TsaD [Candidatus Paceibacterota bacterium]
MRILGIETSCDETAVSLIEAEGDFDARFRFRILGDLTRTQAIHAQYGGVYPSLAKREHAANFVPILEAVLAEANLPSEEPAPLAAAQARELEELLAREPALFEQLARFFETHGKPEIDAIAVTAGPGLEPALWVGINAARALGKAWGIPLVSANHMEGHIAVSAMSEGGFAPALAFPALALLVSGGHTEFIRMDAWMAYEKIGETRDDAVGEAFDKTARLLGLPYPGGPELSRLAAEHRARGAEDAIAFPRSMVHSGDLDFSFSGLKTAVRVYKEKHPETEDAAIARAFEDAVGDILAAKTRTALEETGAQTLIIGGGVSANTYLRDRLARMLGAEFPQTALLLPPPSRATDNALMIALAGYFRAVRHEYADPAAIRAEGTRQL